MHRDSAPEGRDPLRELLHVWFVVYNPIYLVSAALVLPGLWLVQLGLAERGGDLGYSGVSALAELYALCLLGGAAILHRLDQRRPAVLLVLLAALYQCDLTLHVETSAFVGAIGVAGAATWVLLFALKLELAFVALGLRPSRWARLVPLVGAATFAGLPLALPWLSHDVRTPIVAIAVHGLGAFALLTDRHVACAHGFDVRGRRVARAVWVLLGLAALVHAGSWCVLFGVDPTALVIAVALLPVLRVREERSAWAMLVAVSLIAVVRAPEALPLVGCLAFSVLTLRARFRVVPPPPLQSFEPPYRGAHARPEGVVTEHSASPEVFVVAPRAERRRLLAGAAFWAWLAVASLLDRGRGALFEHALVVDAALVLVLAGASLRTRRPALLAPLAPVALHAGAAHGVLVRPATALGLGAWAIGLGFALLGAGLGVSAWLARPPRGESEAGA